MRRAARSDARPERGVRQGEGNGRGSRREKKVAGMRRFINGDEGGGGRGGGRGIFKTREESTTAAALVWELGRWQNKVIVAITGGTSPRIGTSLMHASVHILARARARVQVRIVSSRAVVRTRAITGLYSARLLVYNELI